MRRILPLLLLAMLAGCGTPTITAARLSADLGPTYRNMYVFQQQLLGHGRVPTSADTAWSRCTRGGSSTSDSGAGDGWSCLVHWPAPDGHTETLAYEVSVAPDGCYTAQGPSGYVGQQTLTTPDGRRVTNPLYEFDGCLRG
ncbi:hypothetical protein [Actinocatenispora rupis]|uniref:Lipoprotein n=1 Tax=Actinocatenispora rupis TaxID=519421 RepID=A0A8J3J0Z2_9ACTN|nr:hypothetical protein [Actinocatenispora rupis]GID12555.1 hypothetical protein Aru02nite_34440 [Actinocatenispora rupis]